MAGFEGMRLGAGRRPALLIVDVIGGFTDPDCPLGMPADAVVAAIERLRAAFRARGFPVFYTRVAYDSDAQASIFRRHIPALNLLKAGEPLAEIDPRLTPGPGETVVTKHYASAFFDTDLRARLREQGVDTLYVTGLTTSGCVRASAVDGLQCNLRVIVPREAVGDWDAAAHEANLRDLARKYADVVALEEALAQLPPERGGSTEAITPQ